MKKTAFIFALLAVLCLISSCCPRYIFIPIPTPEDKTTPYDVETPEEFSSMLEATGQARLMENMTINALSFEEGKNYTIDLDGHSLNITPTASIETAKGAEVEFVDGDISIDVSGAAQDSAMFAVGEGGKLRFDGVNLNTRTASVVLKYNDTELNIINSSVTSEIGAAISTNASLPPDSVKINIIDSYINSPNCGAIIFNVEGDLLIQDSEVEAGAQAVIVRCGYADIINSTLHTTGNDDPSVYETLFGNGNWNQGNGVQYGTLIIGNAKGIGYAGTTDVYVDDNSRILIDCEMPLVYVATCEGSFVNVDISDDYGNLLFNEGYHYFGSNGGTITVNSKQIPNE